MKPWRILSVVFPVVGLALGILVGTAIQRSAKAKDVRAAQDKALALEEELSAVKADVEFYKPFQAEAGALRLKLTELQRAREEFEQGQKEEMSRLQSGLDEELEKSRKLRERVKELEEEVAQLEEESELPTPQPPAPTPARPQQPKTQSETSTVADVFGGKRVSKSAQSGLMGETESTYVTLDQAFQDDAR